MRHFGDWPLRWKMLALIVMVSALPLALTAVVEWRESNQLSESSTESLLQANAEDIGSDVDFLNDSFQRAAARLSRLPSIIELTISPEALTPAASLSETRAKALAAKG